LAGAARVMLPPTCARAPRGLVFPHGRGRAARSIVHRKRRQVRAVGLDSDGGGRAGGSR
jgi:hypothetical protein